MTHPGVKLAKPRSGKYLQVLSGLAAGRCEFRGCNKDLMRHSVSGVNGNFSEGAHIYAFSENGPRGKKAGRPHNIDSLGNLILLCKECHHLIDNVEPEVYSVDLLEKFKKEHEERIFKQTSVGPHSNTHVVTFIAKIKGQADVIATESIVSAIQPLWARNRPFDRIDLTGIDSESSSGVGTAKKQIQEDVKDFYRSIVKQEAQSVSVFAVGPMYLLTYFGSRMSNKVKTNFFHKQRDHDVPWNWKRSRNVQFEIKCLQVGTNKNHVALVLSLSGKIDAEGYKANIDDSYYVYEIIPKDEMPMRDLLKGKKDLEAFREKYREFFDVLVGKHPALKEIRVFPAVPAVVAVTMGFDLLHKRHPKLHLYDYVGHEKGFIKKLTI